MRTMLTMKAMLSKELRRALVFIVAMVCMTVAIMLLLMVQVEAFSVTLFVISKLVGIALIVFASCLFRALDIVN